MTVGELKEMLEDFEDDIEVRIMSQPQWPFEYEIQGGTTKQDLAQAAADESGRKLKEIKAEDNILYLVEGSQLGYGDKNAWNLV